MAGIRKEKIDYAGWDVDIFHGDAKIDKLLDAHGWKGFGVYFYLCQQAYGTHGYYLEWGYDDCATTARRMGGGIVSRTIEESVRFCLRIGLFDTGLFDRWSILTSRGIQRRFWDVVSRGRRVRLVCEEYWLLEPGETPGVKTYSISKNALPANGDMLPTLPANGDMLPAHGDMLPAHDPKRKGKESKGKENNNGGGINTSRARENFAPQPPPPQQPPEPQNDFGRVVDYYAQRIGDIPSAIATREIQHYTDMLPADVVIHAIDRADAEGHVRQWSYIQGILRNYERQTLTTMGAVTAAERRHEMGRQDWRQRNSGDGWNRAGYSADSGKGHTGDKGGIPGKWEGLLGGAIDGL